ncbi:MAG: DUF5906 domain-containing protein, partial [Dissulfurispiraceae bacterium]
NDLSNTRLLKQLTGGDLIQADRKFLAPVKFLNYAKLIFSTNQIPRTTDQTDAFFRRAFIVEFPNQFEDNPEIEVRIRDTEAMRHEYEGLLKYSIDTLQRLKRQNFVFMHQKGIEAAKAHYMHLAHPLNRFIHETCEQTWNSDDYIFKYEFRENLNNWLQERKFNTFSDKRIKQDLAALGFEDAQKGEKNYRAWVGIKWLDTTFTGLTPISQPVLKDIRTGCEYPVNPVNPVYEGRHAEETEEGAEHLVKGEQTQQVVACDWRKCGVKLKPLLREDSRELDYYCSKTDGWCMSGKKVQSVLPKIEAVEDISL